MVSESGEASLSSSSSQEARRGRVTHLSPCTEYSCSVAYPDKEGSWSITSPSVSDYTWVKGVTISQPTRVQYYMVARDLHITWGGPEFSGKCVTEYIINYSDTDIRLPADGPYSHVISETEASSLYNISLTATSSGWGDEVVGETLTFSVDTGDYDLLVGVRSVQ